MEFRIYKPGEEDYTTLTFQTKDGVLNFLCSVYDHVREDVYNDGSLFRCKTTAISQYKLCEWVMKEIKGEDYGSK